MKSNKIIKLLAGLVIFLFTIFISIYFFIPKTPPINQISLDAALTKISNKEVSAVVVSQDTLELATKSNEKFLVKIDASDSTRDQIYAAAKGTETRIELEPASSNWNWFVWVSVILNALPLLILTGIFGVLIYIAVMLSRNKG